MYIKNISLANAQFMLSGFEIKKSWSDKNFADFLLDKYNFYGMRLFAVDYRLMFQ